MSYTVLARKYRSRTFDEVIGQEPIASTLSNAVESGRIHHGYLFTGTRGSGKTSMARILAKSLNCLSSDAPTVKPCLKCDACLAISEGQDLDVVEIDAASNTGVDNIRELRSNAAFRPARCRFKIYIIDEVHMLSTGAFNALLKTLEEPPEHVKFILATTEVHKVPATIQSRCQRFNFRNIPPEAVAKRLEFICKQEGIAADQAVIRRVARLANGSMRDALSVLDQLISVSPKDLSADVLDEILPPTQDEQIFKLLSRAIDGDVSGVLIAADDIFSGGRGLENFCNDTIDILRTLMLLRACGADTTVVDVPASAREEYIALAGRFELSQFVQLIAMFEELRRNVRFSGAGRALTDALLVRVAHMNAWSPIERVISQLSGGAPALPGTSDEKKKHTPPLAVPPARGGDQPMQFSNRAAAPQSGNAAPASFATSAGPIRTASAPHVLQQDPPRGAPSYDQSKHAAPQPGGTTSKASVVAMNAVPAVSRTAPTERESAYGAPAHGTAVAVEPDTSNRAPLIDDDGDVWDEPPPEVAAAAEQSAANVAHRSLTGDERARVMRDPVVQQALDLFDGVIVNVERVTGAEAKVPGSSAGDETES